MCAYSVALVVVWVLACAAFAYVWLHRTCASAWRRVEMAARARQGYAPVSQSPHETQKEEEDDADTKIDAQPHADV